MKKLVPVLLCVSVFFLPACIFRRPIEVKKEYYASGNLKLVRKIYKNGTERKIYYTDGPTHREATGKERK